MKFLIAVLFLFILFGFSPKISFAQKKTITVVIFRHADKEAAVEGDDSDTDISIEGQKRAVRLVKVLEKYKPARLYSTNYARTIQTVTPLSRIRNLPVEFYQPGEMNALVEKILSSENARNFAVVGHNSTAYQLVNLLLKDSKYKMPDETDYGRIWVIKIKNGKVKDKILSY